MASIKIPYIAWRDGRPRFAPGPRERKLGFAGQDLRHGEAGAWFTFEETRAWAQARQTEIAARRAGKKRRTHAVEQTNTVADLLRAWLASDHVASLGANTQDGYRKQVEAICWQPGREAREDLSLWAAAAVEKPEAKSFIEYQMRVRGKHMGRASRAVLNAAYTWGETSVEWRLKSNPFARLRLPKPKGRIVIFTDTEINVLVETADENDAASAGDAIILGLFSGQRQSDRLCLEDAGLVDGRRQFRQNKTGVVIAMPEHPALRARLDAARARVAALALKLGTRPKEIVVNEKTGLAYNAHTYRHVFAEIRAKAARKCPSLAGKRDQDLRDTAVTWLARAGATIPEIAAITGHSLKSIHTILTHYLAITPELADAAIAKLVAWMEREGMAV